MDPVQALRQIAFELERAGEPTYRVRAFRRAAAVLDGLPPGQLEQRLRSGTLEALPGIGATTARVVTEAAAGREPGYLTRLLSERPVSAPPDGLRAALRGDCHTHSDWSDGGSPPVEMAEAARALGHEWIALTDHSPRLTVANGLSAERLEAQLSLIQELNAALAPFRILTGIEVDILEDGSLDQREDLLARLDMVVASVHSQLRMPAGPMTERMVAAIRNPNVDVLGHCTGRLLGVGRQGGRGRRPESVFDPGAVFTACREHGVAVEINCRPERMDPPDRLLGLAVEAGCLFAIDTDAHAPGQLDWLGNGTVRAEEFGITAERVINTRSAAAVTAGRRLRGAGLGASPAGLRPGQRLEWFVGHYGAARLGLAIEIEQQPRQILCLLYQTGIVNDDIGHGGGCGDCWCNPCMACYRTSTLHLEDFLAHGDICGDLRRKPCRRRSPGIRYRRWNIRASERDYQPNQGHMTYTARLRFAGRRE